MRFDASANANKDLLNRWFIVPFPAEKYKDFKELIIQRKFKGRIKVISKTNPNSFFFQKKS